MGFLLDFENDDAFSCADHLTFGDPKRVAKKKKEKIKKLFSRLSNKSYLCG